MMTINTIGRITKDFELKTGEKTGRAYTNFSIAVNEGFGENQKTTFFECTAFDHNAERLINAKAKKGSLIYVTGKFGKSDFTRNNGEPGYSLKIAVHDWNYIPGTGGQKDNNGGNNGNGNNGGAGNGTAQPPNPETYQPDEGYYNEMNLDDDDTDF
jgi:single-strand DNA-binding protein